MRSFDYHKYESYKWDNDLVLIHECKGRQELFSRQKPVELKRLVEWQACIRKLMGEGYLQKRGSKKDAFYFKSF